MSALDDLTAYLTTTLAGKYGDAVLSQVLGTEIADQAARLRARYRMADPAADWAGHMPPLRESVMRRCARNLALRKIPLGISESDIASLRVAGRDTEIKRLEAPYLRMTVG